MSCKHWQHVYFRDAMQRSRSHFSKVWMECTYNGSALWYSKDIYINISNKKNKQISRHQPLGGKIPLLIHFQKVEAQLWWYPQWYLPGHLVRPWEKKRLQKVGLANHEEVEVGGWLALEIPILLAGHCVWTPSQIKNTTVIRQMCEQVD